MLQTETLWALLHPAAFPAADFAAAWKNVALWSEHTWGAYNSISQPDLPFVKTQWKFKQAFALDADRQSRKLLEQAAGARGAGVSPAVGVDRARQRDGTPHNAWTCSTRRRGRGPIWSPCPRRPRASGVKDEQGRLCRRSDLSTGELVFLARDVPPFAARRFTIDNGRRPSAVARPRAERHDAADTPTLSLKLDPATGAIVSLKSALTPCPSPEGEGNLRRIGQGPDQQLYLSARRQCERCKAQRAGEDFRQGSRGRWWRRCVVESDAPGCKQLVREVRVIDGLDRVEIIDMVDKLPVRAIEGVHFGFAFNVPNPEVRINSPGAVVRPEKDQLPGACKNWFSVERWVDVSNDNYGVTWVTADAPLMELGGLTANLPRGQPNPNAYMKTIEPSATLYSWVMNNHWHTNYRADQEGETTFRYYLRPHGAYDAVAAARFGLETTQPLIVAPAVGEKPAASRLSVEPAGVLVSALKPSDDGKAIIVRLYGASGKDAVAKLAWSKPEPKAVWLSDASEQPLAQCSGGHRGAGLGHRDAPGGTAVKVCIVDIGSLLQKEARGCTGGDRKVMESREKMKSSFST